MMSAPEFTTGTLEWETANANLTTLSPDNAPDAQPEPTPEDVNECTGVLGCWWAWLLGALVLAGVVVFGLAYWRHAVANQAVLIYAMEPLSLFSPLHRGWDSHANTVGAGLPGGDGGSGGSGGGGGGDSGAEGQLEEGAGGGDGADGEAGTALPTPTDAAAATATPPDDEVAPDAQTASAATVAMLAELTSAIEGIM
jgi:hypothetical protein